MVRLLIIALLIFSSGLCCASAGTLLDPMRPERYIRPVGKAESSADQDKTKDWILSAVLVSSDRSVAVINDVSLRVGDKLEGYKLVQVDRDKVVLKRESRTVVLQMAGIGLKKISTDKVTMKGNMP